MWSPEFSAWLCDRCNTPTEDRWLNVDAETRRPGAEYPDPPTDTEHIGQYCSDACAAEALLLRTVVRREPPQR